MSNVPFWSWAATAQRLADSSGIELGEMVLYGKGGSVRLGTRGQVEVRSDDQARANRLADECGRLKDENRSLMAENAELRRRAERLERGRR